MWYIGDRWRFQCHNSIFKLRAQTKTKPEICRKQDRVLISNMLHFIPYHVMNYNYMFIEINCQKKKEIFKNFVKVKAHRVSCMISREMRIMVTFRSAPNGGLSTGDKCMHWFLDKMPRIQQTPPKSILQTYRSKARDFSCKFS